MYRREHLLDTIAGLVAIVFLVFTLFVIFTARPAHAAGEQYRLTDLKHRMQFSVSSGYLQFAPTGGDAWQGIDAEAIATYSVAPNGVMPLSLFALYGHGFPTGRRREQANRALLAANLKLYPGPATPTSKWTLFAGAGPQWLGTDTVKGSAGLEAHLSGSFDLGPRLVAFGTYSHMFASTKPDPDVDLFRLALNLGIWP